MPIFKVRLSGNAPVWADVEVEAPDSVMAMDAVTQEIADGADWEFCGGGNGVDDWSTTGDVFDADGNELEEGV